MSPTTRSNVEAFLGALGIPGVEIQPDLPDQDRSRVLAFDTQGKLLQHCFVVTEFWSRDSGRNHGKGVRGSFRSRTTPSLQVCIERVKRGKYLYVCEIDLDEFSPVVNLIGHAGEVGWHEISGQKTDPAKIALGLQQLLPQIPAMIEAFS